jgi:hypothetical protein
LLGAGSWARSIEPRKDAGGNLAKQNEFSSVSRDAGAASSERTTAISAILRTFSRRAERFESPVRRQRSRVSGFRA